MSDSEDFESFSDDSDDEIVVSEKKPESRHIRILKEKLGLDSLLPTVIKKSIATDKPSVSTSSKQFEVSTAASRLKVRPPAEVVVFVDPDKKKDVPSTSKDDASKPSSNDDVDGEIMDMIQTKHEVQRFSMEALTKKKKKESQIDLLIKLGAKPAKNVAKRYNILKHDLHMQRKQEKDDREVNRRQGLGQANKYKPKKKYNKNQVRGFDRAFAGGVRKLTSKDRGALRIKKNKKK